MDESMFTIKLFFVQKNQTTIRERTLFLSSRSLDSAAHAMLDEIATLRKYGATIKGYSCTTN